MGFRKVITIQDHQLEEIERLCALFGISPSQFIRDAIDDKILKDTKIKTKIFKNVRN